MNTKIAWIALIIVLAALGAWYALSPKSATAPTDTATTAEETAAEPMEESADASVTTVTLTDAGFSPASVTIAIGQTVRFVNQSSRGMWIGSDEHPTHTEYDGTTTREHCANGANTNGTFDQCTAGASGSSWEYTFLKAGTFGYHNHVGASNTGTVVVK